MNILHHKSWHVRNKQNIERVKRDEAKAAAEEKEKERRKALAESEARTELLLVRAHKQQTDASSNTDRTLELQPQSHINFFKDEEAGLKQGTNKEHEAEKKAEQEKQEKAIGLLTYLGQSAVESQNEEPWYFKPPEKRRKIEEKPCPVKKEEFDLKHKWSSDPMKMMRTYLSTKEKIEERDKGSQSQSRTIQPISDQQSTENKHDHIRKSQLEGVKLRVCSTLVKKKHKDKGRKKSKKKDHKKDKKDRKHMKKKSKKRHSSESEPEESSSVPKIPATVTSSGKTIQQLRAERLRREMSERTKTEELIRKMNGEPPKTKENEQFDERNSRYNSQFNPDFVRRKRKRDEMDLDCL